LDRFLKKVDEKPKRLVSVLSAAGGPQGEKSLFHLFSIKHPGKAC
jgi:hypothetical protein